MKNGYKLKLYKIIYYYCDPIVFAAAFNFSILQSIATEIQCFWYCLCFCYSQDSSRSSLSQLVARYTRYGRFIRRHLFGLGPITHCQLVLGSTGCVARPAEGHTSPPGSQAYAGPNGDDAGVNASRVPPSLPCYHDDPRPPAASQRAPRGPRTCRTAWVT
jgi:hypothetical protein